MRAKSTRKRPCFAIDKRIDAILALDNGLEEMLSTKQLASWLGISAGWLSVRRADGTGPPFEKDGYNIRYPRGKARVWLKSRKE
jgi:hypothetical protein